MKKLLILAVAFMVGGSAFAQDKMDKKMEQSTTKMHGKMKDCVMMEGGKMMVMKGGSTTAMEQDMKMANGATVMTDGTVKMKDGTTKMLKDGQCVYMNGKMGMMKMDKMKGDKM